MGAAIGEVMSEENLESFAGSYLAIEPNRSKLTSFCAICWWRDAATSARYDVEVEFDPSRQLSGCPGTSPAGEIDFVVRSRERLPSQDDRPCLPQRRGHRTGGVAPK